MKSDYIRAITYSLSRTIYARPLDGVIDDREEVVITRASRDQVVIVSLEDYEALKKTAYSLKAPRMRDGYAIVSIDLSQAKGSNATRSSEADLGRKPWGVPVVAGTGPQTLKGINTLLQDIAASGHRPKRQRRDRQARVPALRL